MGARSCCVGLINQAFCISDMSALPDELMKDLLVLYFNGTLPVIDNEEPHARIENLKKWIVELVNSPPSQSFMELTFFQVFRLLPKLDNGTLVELSGFPIFIKELQASYDTMCGSDRKTVGRILDTRMTLEEVKSDAAFLIHWALIEAAKFLFKCNSSLALPIDQYLARVDIIVSSTNFFNKFQALLLCSFWSLLDKQLQARLSTPMSKEDVLANSYRRFLIEYGNKWQNNLLNLRQEFAKLALVADNPAECWRNADKELYTKTGPMFSNPKVNFYTNRTSMHPDFKGWRETNQLLMAGARQLGDSNLLKGLSRTYANDEFDTGEHLQVMLANLEGHYENAYEAFLKIANPTDQTLIEFLQSAIELGRYDQFPEQAEKLRSTKLKFLYKQYYEIVLSGKLAPRAGDVKHWLSSWTGMDANSNATNCHSQPIQTQINMIAPILLASIARDPTNIKLVTEARQMIGSDLVTHSLFCLESVNKDLQLFHILINSIAGFDSNGITALDAQIIECHSGDGLWNHKLYRLAKDFNLNQKFESVSYRAAKFNFKKGNIDLANRIAQELIDGRTFCYETKVMASILMTRYESTNEKTKLAELCSLAAKVSLSNDISPIRKRDIVLDIAKAQLKLVGHVDLAGIFKDLAKVQHEELQFSQSQHSNHAHQIPKLSEKFAPKSGHDKKVVKTLIAISDIMYAEVSELNYAPLFLLQVDLLRLIANQPRQPFGFDGHGLKCASKILELILNFCDDMDETLEETFVRSFEDTLPIWLNMRRNVISLLVSRKGLTALWLVALEDLLHRLVVKYPFLFVYDLLLNLTESDMRQLARKISDGDDKLDDLCRSKKIWYQVYNILKELNVDGVDLGDMLLQTRKFAEELRKISYLPTDLMLKVAFKALRTISRFHKYDSPEGVDPKLHSNYVKSAQTMAKRHIHSGKILFAYCKGGATPLDTWFSTNLGTLIKTIYDNLKLVLNERTSFGETFRAVTGCKSALEQCSLKVSQFYEDSKHKLFTKMFSPMLSRLELNNILIPDYNLNCVFRAPVVVKSVSHAITIIHSSTAPKSLKLLGSDGQNRVFLLKSHEDLRLDQAVMELYSALNMLFQSEKTTRNPPCRLRGYSVTPLSSRSGLIRWVEALSLSSILTDWLKSPTSRQIVETLYEETCRVLCNQTGAREGALGAHERCRPSKSTTYLDVFYQVLWAQLGREADKPTRAKSLGLRSLKPACFAGALRTLVRKVPNELVSQHLWLNSYNAHEYWSKTQNFIRSYATASVVGYLIGLGDRHLGNILLDCRSGEIVHVDYNLCFDLAKSSISPIPERVPFRLTQNILRAFGFAGLEGGFTSCSRDLLRVLRANKSILLSHLNSTRLDFMIGPSVALAKSVQTLNPEPIECELSGETGAISLQNSQATSSSIQTFICKNDAKDDIRTPPKLSPAKSRQIFARIDEKLSGFDGQLLLGEDCRQSQAHSREEHYRMTVDQQVDALIREATSFENQAAMFEGWMAWV